jgi:hypothetical protein
LEFCIGIFLAKLKQLGISQEFTLCYEHEQAGIAENTSCTIMEKARTMLHASDMNESFWPNAFHTAIFVTNCSWHYGMGGIPYEKFTGHIANVQMILKKEVKFFFCLFNKSYLKKEVKFFLRIFSFSSPPQPESTHDLDSLPHSP